MTVNGDPRPRVLVVEDDEPTRRLICRTVEQWAGTPIEADCARSAIERLAEQTPDVVILDLGLPDLDGTQLLRLLMQRGGSAVIVVSGRASPDERALGLELGAADYLIKPFHPSELTSRLDRLLSKAPDPSSPAPSITVGALTLDVARRLLLVDGEAVELTRREFDLLATLVRNAGTVLTRQELLVEVWASDPGWQSVSTVTEHVRRVRRKLGDAGRNLETVRGVGYRFLDQRGAA